MFFASVWSRGFKLETTITTRWNCAAQRPQLKYDHISAATTDGNNITTTVNCLETHSLNLNVLIDTIRIFNMIGRSAAQYFGLDKGQHDKLPDYRGPLPDVVNCQRGTWPDPIRVYPHSFQGAAYYKFPMLNRAIVFISSRHVFLRVVVAVFLLCFPTENLRNFLKSHYLRRHENQQQT